MIRKTFSDNQKKLHHLILHANDSQNEIGLLHGKTGIMLVLAHYSRVHKLPFIEEAADYLMNSIINSISCCSIDFSNGLSGVGWAIEYLTQNKYVNGNGAEICSEIDKRIMSYNIKRIDDYSLETGLTGLMHYIVAHIQGGYLSGANVFDDVFLEDIKKILINNQKTNNMGYWLELFNLVSMGKVAYKLNLKEFIALKLSKSYKRLGLQDGLAGALELQL